MHSIRLISSAALLWFMGLICGCTVKLGSETMVIRENKEGTAIATMKDVEVVAKRLQEDGTIKDTKVTIKQEIVIRVGIECVFKDIDQILTQEDCEFDAMVPGANGQLRISHVRVPKLTGIKLGTVKWIPPNTTGDEPVPVDQSKLPVTTTVTDPTPDRKPMR